MPSGTGSRQSLSASFEHDQVSIFVADGPIGIVSELFGCQRSGFNDGAPDSVLAEQVAVVTGLLELKVGAQQRGRIRIVPVVDEDRLVRNEPNHFATQAEGVVDRCTALTNTRDGLRGERRPIRLLEWPYPREDDE